MDKAALVEKDLRVGRDILGLLTAAGIPVDEAFWVYDTQAQDWRLVLSSPKVSELGERQSYLQMLKLLHRSPLVKKLKPALVRFSVFAPGDEEIKRLRALENYRYEGALEIIRSDPKNGHPFFSVFFAPYRGGGSVKTVELRGEAKLENFLRDEAGIFESDVKRALGELAAHGSYSFENLQLSTAKLRKLDLLHPRVPRRVA